MPIPGCRFEAEMMIGFEVPRTRAEEADDQEDRADENVETMETGRHVERRRINPLTETERRVAVFEGLNTGKADAEEDRQDRKSVV